MDIDSSLVGHLTFGKISRFMAAPLLLLIPLFYGLAFLLVSLFFGPAFYAPYFCAPRLYSAIFAMPSVLPFFALPLLMPLVFHIPAFLRYRLLDNTPVFCTPNFLLLYYFLRSSL